MSTLMADITLPAVIVVVVVVLGVGLVCVCVVRVDGEHAPL